MFIWALVLSALSVGSYAGSRFESSVRTPYEELLGSRVGMDGPNCFNAVLLGRGFPVSIRQTSNYEILAWMNAGACRILRRSELPRLNDIGIIGEPRGFGFEFVPIHAFLYTSRFWAFEKRGYKKKWSYELRSVSAILEDRSAARDCKVSDFNCHPLRIYRCNSVAGVTTKGWIREIEQKVEGWVTGEEPLPRLEVIRAYQTRLTFFGQDGQALQREVALSLLLQLEGLKERREVFDTAVHFRQYPEPCKALMSTILSLKGEDGPALRLHRSVLRQLYLEWPEECSREVHTAISSLDSNGKDEVLVIRLLNDLEIAGQAQ